MNAVLAVSILLRLFGTSYSLVLLYRSRDRRFAFLTAMLALMTTRQLWTAQTTRTGLEELPGLVVSGLAVLTVFYLSQYVEEEDRVTTSLQRANERLRSFRKAVEHAGHAIFLTDPDGTITYANPAIEDVTGYTPAEVVGENPRLWKSGEHDADFYAEMWGEITAGNVWDGEIVNERKDGEQCWVDMTIAPISDDEGDIERYVAVDTDVTDRKRRELQICEQNAELVLLNNTNEVLRDVTRRLVEATTREEIERAVCETFASPPFSFAWIGSVNMVNDSLEVRDWEGADATRVRALADAFTETPDATPIDRAHHEGTAVTTAGSDADWCPDCERTALAAIPLVHRGVSYGVLVVHATDADTLEAVDTDVLAELGRTIGYALNATASRQALVSDDVTELEFRVSDTDDPLVELARSLACDLELQRVSPDGDELVEYFSITGATADDVTAHVASTDRITDGEVLRAHDDGCVVRFVVDETAIVSTLTDHGGAAIRSFSLSADDCRLRVELPSHADPRALVDALQRHHPGIDLTARREREQPQDPGETLRESITASLTDRQQEALRTAYDSGFFAWPRDSSGEDVAATMDINQSTFHQHLRAAERKVFDELFDRTEIRTPA
ncbi:hypothetical protein BV210_06660 [Halorientalis sp. IM1011]|uniref:bacterio-opsin activator domain-containing protein n=1 Tax=Halorientalis sp. IM1011 TaxID=1932360 RepID=UPI00097CC1B4|nr:bacterio-opsin activator domain-containing protein [Halorientalis sp. IM1011]AQL42413.1 hypothetical protein BV210_06660 [Halorientalis sp. IM1011]